MRLLDGRSRLRRLKNPLQSKDDFDVRLLMWNSIPSELAALVGSLVAPTLAAVVGVAVHTMPDVGVRCLAPIILADFFERRLFIAGVVR
jgi:hypothetical protein